MQLRNILLPLTILLLAGGIAWAGTTGKIAGKVTDAETGEPLPGVNVVVEGTYRGAATDLEGMYSILNISPGTYTVKFSSIGYNPVAYENVQVSVDRTVRLDAELTPEVLEAGEEVVFIARRPTVKMDVTSTEVSVGSEQIDAIPVENFGDVVNLQAGVVDGHFRGGRSSEVVYMIDGVVISDPYSSADPFGRSTSNQVENAAIQEIQVIAGTFNAEYGQAMSGVVNVVTKDGNREEYHGNVTVAAGDYVSDRSLDVGMYDDTPDEETYLDDLKPGHLQDYQGSLSGPVPYTRSRLTFFASGRYQNDHGRLYGQRIFTPSDSSNFTALDPANWHMERTGDNDIVTLDPFSKLSGQAKLTCFLSPEIKLTYSLMRDHIEFSSIGKGDLGGGIEDDDDEDLRLFKYNPGGLYNIFRNGSNHIFGLNHVLNGKTFYDFRLSYAANEHEFYVHDDPYSDAYVNPDRLMDAQGRAFYTGGTGMWQHWRRTRKAGMQLDMTHQLNQLHLLKGGFELQQYQLELEEYKLLWDEQEGRQKIEYNSVWYNTYKAHDARSPLGGLPFSDDGFRPLSFAVFLQDKMEYESMVVNFGVRFDYFHSDGEVPLDPRDPGNDSLSIYDYDTGQTVGGLDPVNPTNPDGTYNSWRYKYRDAEAFTQLSPRVGVAFPLTAQGVIHFSYGHFFQVPPFQYLYHNPDFEVIPGGLQSKIGNAELKPQRTVMYEIGFKQELAPRLGMNTTLFYKDIRNLLGTEIQRRYDQELYARYVNRDYANVRGITLALNHQMVDGFAFSLDYTYQIAEGNASDPDEVFKDNQADPPREPEKKVRPLDWDQTHTLNGVVSYALPGRWNFGIIGSFGSGLPYTSHPWLQPEGDMNDSRKPTHYNVDVKASKGFDMGRMTATITLWVYNIFDIKNELDVYSDTGRATYTLEANQPMQIRGINTADDFYTRPSWYSAPRQVKLGLSVSF